MSRNETVGLDHGLWKVNSVAFYLRGDYRLRVRKNGERGGSEKGWDPGHAGEFRCYQCRWILSLAEVGLYNGIKIVNSIAFWLRAIVWLHITFGGDASMATDSHGFCLLLVYSFVPFIAV